MGIVFTDVVAACEIVNCNVVEFHCQGLTPTISVDNTGGCQLYLSKESLGASITTAKSSEINVSVPGGGLDADWVLSTSSITKKMKLTSTKTWISFLRLPLPVDVYEVFIFHTC
ncbi:PREDICTED: cyclase-associated protein 1-like [Nelumbo nucifera]|nr:PREDICTED: cyclase-associated protein 1-like [Nelumbo nucifera]XP_010259919.1 PREDICTED: cyclase-associated protein 1-like [Nelumbo nucifera]